MAAYESPLATRYATAAMVANFADERRVLVWRDLWIALARAEQALGVPITDAQVEALVAHREEIDLRRVAELEAELRHDVMAHVRHYGERVGEAAEKIIHLGATSCYVTDNAELVMMRDGLELLMDRLVTVIEQLAAFARAHRELPTLAYTHFQPAQLTTVGKRACLWAQDLVLDLETLQGLRARLPFRGVKGTTGTQASFLALFAKADVRDLPAYQATIDGMAGKLGAFKVLVNNAARDDRHTIDQVTPTFWDERIAVNLRHQYFAIQSVVPGMRKAGGGSIINFSSVSYHAMTPQLSVYQAAKAAVIGMTRGLARDLGPDNIRLNSLTPGWIMTQRQIDLWLTPEGEKDIYKNQCLKRKLMPDELAKAVLFLASEESSGMTNQSIIVDAGWV